MKRLVLSWAAACAMVLASGLPAHAQATRTWVSGVGDDVNPCSRTAPCKTFAGAISKTAAGGEIDVLDPGGFGTLTITKSITIDGTGTFASILSSGVNGIIVSSTIPAGSVVTIRGLSINGAGTTLGLNGIRVLGPASLHVENCVIFGFSSVGIDFEPSSSTAHLTVKDTVIRQNGGGGILSRPAVGAFARGSLQNVRLERNAFGLRAEDRSAIGVDGSVFSNNTNNGLLVISAGVEVDVNVQNSRFSDNGTNGVASSNAGAIARLATSLIVHNGNLGLAPVGGGAIISFGNNRVAGNSGGDGAPTGTVGEM